MSLLSSRGSSLQQHEPLLSTTLMISWAQTSTPWFAPLRLFVTTKHWNWTSFFMFVESNRLKMSTALVWKQSSFSVLRCLVSTFWMLPETTVSFHRLTLGSYPRAAHMSRLKTSWTLDTKTCLMTFHKQETWSLWHQTQTKVLSSHNSFLLLLTSTISSPFLGVVLLSIQSKESLLESIILFKTATTLAMEPSCTMLWQVISLFTTAWSNHLCTNHQLETFKLHFLLSHSKANHWLISLHTVQHLEIWQWSTKWTFSHHLFVVMGLPLEMNRFALRKPSVMFLLSPLVWKTTVWWWVWM